MQGGFLDRSHCDQFLGFSWRGRRVDRNYQDSLVITWSTITYSVHRNRGNNNGFLIEPVKVGYDDCQCFSLPCWFEDQLLEGWADGDDLFIIKIVLVPSNDASRFRMKNFKLVDSDSDVLNKSILLLEFGGE